MQITTIIQAFLKKFKIFEKFLKKCKKIKNAYIIALSLVDFLDEDWATVV